MASKGRKQAKDTIYKATSSKDAPPKEKHVRVIVTKTFHKDGSSEEIIRTLAKRMDKTHWAIVLKSLVVFHRCFKDGDPNFMESLKTRSGVVFALRTFSTSAGNNAYTLFVKKYAKYLEEKVSVLRLVGFQFETQKDVCKGIKPPKALKIVPKLQSQLNALLNCKMRSQTAGIANLVKSVYMLLLQDSLPLYSHLNDGISSLLDLFWKMPKQQANKVLEIYKLYVKETDALISLYEIGKRFVNKLPTVRKAETSIIEQMEAYVNSAQPGDDGDHSSEDERDISGLQTNMNHLMSNPGGPFEDDKVPDHHDSSGDDDDSSEDADPFASFLTNNPFAGFSFTAPVFAPPPSFAPMGGPNNGANPFATNTAGNPFTTQQPAFQTGGFTTNNPFATTPTPVYGATVMSNPGQTSPSFGFGSPPAPTYGAAVTSNPGQTSPPPFSFGSPAPTFAPTPQPGIATNNPFATTPAVSPFGAQPNAFGTGSTLAFPQPTQPAPYAQSNNPFMTTPAPAVNNPFATNPFGPK